MNISNRTIFEHFINVSNSEEFVILIQNQYEDISDNDETKKKLQRLYASFKKKNGLTVLELKQDFSQNMKNF